MSWLAVDPAVHLTVRSAVSLLFVWAASHKLRHVTAFRSALASYELLPPRWVEPFTGLLIATEIGVAAGMWWPGMTSTAGFAAAGLLATYTGAIVTNLLRGRRDFDCGCAGVAGDRPLSGALVVRNGVLCTAALLIAVPVASRSLTWLDGVTITVGVGTLALLYAAVDALLANAPKIAALAGAHLLKAAPADRSHASAAHEAQHA